jgi:hypothetical protein
MLQNRISSNFFALDIPATKHLFLFSTVYLLSSMLTDFHMSNKCLFNIRKCNIRFI